MFPTFPQSDTSTLSGPDTTPQPSWWQGDRMALGYGLPFTAPGVGIPKAPRKWYMRHLPDCHLTDGLIYALPLWEGVPLNWPANDTGKTYQYLWNYATGAQCYGTTTNFIDTPKATGIQSVPTQVGNLLYFDQHDNADQDVILLDNPNVSVTDCSASIWCCFDDVAFYNAQDAYAFNIVGWVSGGNISGPLDVASVIKTNGSSGYTLNIFGATSPVWTPDGGVSADSINLHHFAMTCRQVAGTSATLSFYCDGQLFYAETVSVWGTVSLGGISVLGNAAQIGPQYPTNSWAGYVGPLHFWQRALLPGEVQQLARDPWLFYRQDIPLSVGNPPYIDGTGGALGGGTAIVWVDYFSNTTNGNGAIAGGQALVGDDEGDIVGSGGALGGGIAIVWVDYFSNTTNGNGAIAGGDAFVQQIIVGSGGAICGGTAPFWGIQFLEGSGGAIAGEAPLFPNGFAYDLEFTVPAGKVEADLPNAVFKVSLSFPPSLITQGRFLFADANGDYLASTILIDFGEGNYLFELKGTLLADQDNWFTVYFA